MENIPPSDADRQFLMRLPPLAGPAWVPRSEIPPLLLAAWAERRLSEDDSADIESALSGDPVLLDDALAAGSGIVAEEVPTEALLERLRGLGDVLAPPAAATVLPFRQAPQAASKRSVGVWLSWGAVAASVALVSFVGFDLGSIVGKSEIAQTTAADTSSVFNDDLD
jgi:hypothetical protein